MNTERLSAVMRKHPREFVLGLDLALLVLAAVLFYLPTFKLLVAEWFRPGVTFYSHGPIVAFISLLLIRRQYHAIGRPNLYLWGSLVILATAILFFFGETWEQPYLIALSFVALIIGIVAISFGRSTARTLAFPILFLVVAIPLPPVFWAATSLTLPVSQLTAGLLQQLGAEVSYAPTVSVFRQTMFPTGMIGIQDNTYLVVPLCTGVNYILALYALLLPLIYITHTSWLRTALFVVAIPFTALVLKILLLAAVIAVTPSVGMERAEELYHGWFGVSTFLLGLLLLVVPLLATAPKGRSLPLVR